MKRIKAVIIKEFFHILRDPTSLTIVFLMPVIMILIFGYSINFDLKSIDVGIIDYSAGEISNQLIKKFTNNQQPSLLPSLGVIPLLRLRMPRRSITVRI